MGTIYLALLGPQGLREVALKSHAGAVSLKERLCALPGVEDPFDAPTFNEFTIKLAKPVSQVLVAMRDHNLLAGLNVADFKAVPDAERLLLVAVTEKRTQAEMDAYVAALSEVLEEALA